MQDYFEEGTKLKREIKSVVLSFIQNSSECSSDGEGLRQAKIFRDCGLDWGKHKNATSSHQQFWLVGLLRELENDGYIQQDEATRKWLLK